VFKKYIETIPESGTSLDVETHRLQKGLKAPPMVVGSASWFESGPKIEGVLLPKDAFLKLFQELAQDSTRVVVGANFAQFDLLVIAREFAKRKIDIMPAIYQLLEEGRLYDIQIAQALHDIAQGHLGTDPRTNSPIINPETGRRGRYSLPYCLDINLGRKDAKVNALYKENYADWENVPIEQWPPEARTYPVDDTNNTHETALAQVGAIPRLSPTHDWGRDGACRDCGSTKLSAQCFVRRPLRNLHDLANQVYTAHAMHMGAARGFRVNQQAVQIVKDYALKKRAATIQPFIDAGIIREDGTVDESTLKRKVAVAYGSKDPCPVCSGTGKVPSPEQKQLRCDTCKGRCQPWKAGGKIKEPTIAFCPACKNTGKMPHPNPKMIGCVSINEYGVKEKTCDGTGYLLTEDVPRSDKEGVGKGKDPCHESGDDFLMSYGDFLEDAKILKDYVPFLEEARVFDEKSGEYKDIPLTLNPNVVLETGRVSYNGYIQLFPRKPGFWEKNKETGEEYYIPSLRECIEARPGYYLASIDYDSGELITHAQSCLWITGNSKLAQALIMGTKVHNMLGASMIGISYDEMMARAKDRVCKNARQAAKPGNFGFPGGMGAVKMVLQQRNQGPDTPHPEGPNWIKAEGSNFLVRGYKGLRFCILMDDAPACGIEKVKAYRDQKIPPTCAHCIDCALRLKKLWLKQWPENNQYFEFINNCIDFGQQITGEMLERWPWLKEVYQPGTQLSPAEIMQHHSGRIRGGLDYCSAANGFFQGLLGDLAKAAVRQVSRECYDKTYRIPTQLFANSKPSAYTGIQSPLYGSHVLAFQHDEILPELVIANAHDAAMRISEVMCDTMRWYCPDLAPAAKAPPALMRKWFKSAEPVFENGRLVPWEPQL
jgi:hypothetical protein